MIIPMVNVLPGIIIFSQPFTPLNPSIAEATDIGGVIIPSANNVPAPMMAGTYNHRRYRRTSANKEKIPPSPLLSAWSVNNMYLKVVCRVSVQNTHEMPP